MSLKSDLELIGSNMADLFRGKSPEQKNAIVQELKRLTATHVSPTGEITSQDLPVQRLNSKTPYVDDRAIPVIPRTSENKEGVKITDGTNTLFLTGGLLPVRVKDFSSGNDGLNILNWPSVQVIAGNVDMAYLVINEYRKLVNTNFSGAQSGVTLSLGGQLLTYFAVSTDSAGDFTLKNDNSDVLIGPIYLGAYGFFAIGNYLDPLCDPSNQTFHNYIFDSTFTGYHTVITQSREG